MGRPSFEVRLANDQRDLIASQKLRYDVFVRELGADGPLVDHAQHLERDVFDDHCDHLIMVDTSKNPDDFDHVVGVYRLLPGDRVAQTGRFYSDGEFDVTALKTSGRRLLELGRSCLHVDVRGGSTLLLIWNALADYVIAGEFEILFGTASFHGTNVDDLSIPLSYLYHNHLAPMEIRTRVRDDVYQTMDLHAPGSITRKAAMLKTPPLIKAYLRLGGTVGDGVFVDHEFNTTDVLLTLDTKNMVQRSRNIYERGVKS